MLMFIRAFLQIGYLFIPNSGTPQEKFTFSLAANGRITVFPQAADATSQRSEAT